MDNIIQKIHDSKKVVLLEPPYKRKYPPLGLAKISTMVKSNGGETAFQRKYMPIGEDVVCITSLFTYDLDKIIESISDVLFLNPKANIIWGGVCATLMSYKLKELFPQIHIYKGYSKELDACSPDYSINWGLEDDWGKFSFVFTSRGCPNHCAYCAVPRLESEMWINDKWKDHIDLTKPYVMISDNNLSAQPLEHIKDICDFLKKNKLRVVFDNGLDCKHITPELAKMLSGLKYYKTGMRLAFDRIEEDGIFQGAINMLINSGVPKSALMAYVLFNFTDKPKEADYRMRECVKLGIRPYPQQYNPLNNHSRDNKYIGKYWTKNLLRVFRYFYLMAGFYTKMTFEEYVQNRETKSDDKYQLNKEDWKAWME